MSRETRTCGYCGKPLPPRTGRGAHQAYCNADEKRLLDRALYFIGRRQLETGVITLADIRALEQTLPKASSRPRSRRRRLARGSLSSSEEIARMRSGQSGDTEPKVNLDTTRPGTPSGRRPSHD